MSDELRREPGDQEQQAMRPEQGDDADRIEDLEVEEEFAERVKGGVTGTRGAPAS